MLARKNHKKLFLLKLNEVVMAFLAIVGGFLLFLEFTQSLTEYETWLFDTIDLIIAFVFLGEFIARVYFAKKRMSFFIHHSWELLTAIPITTPLTQGLRLLRLLRVLRVLHFPEAAEEVV